MPPGQSVDSDVTRSCVLQTPRTRVTAWLPQDLPELSALHADPLVMRYMRSGIEDEPRTRARLTTYLREQTERGWTKWRVVDRTGRMIGRAGFKLSDAGAHRELGYLLEPAQWGRGLATELARALVRWHHQHPDGLQPALYAYAFAANTASRRVLEKSGFVLAGRSEDDGRDVVRYLNPAAEVSSSY